MYQDSGDQMSVISMMAYGLAILVYLLVLKMLVDAFRRNATDASGKSVVDRDLRQHKRYQEYSEATGVGYIANVLAKGIAIAAWLAVVIYITSYKFGLLVTSMIIFIIILVAWVINSLKKRYNVGQTYKKVGKLVNNMHGSVAITGLMVILALLTILLVFL